MKHFQEIIDKALPVAEKSPEALNRFKDFLKQLLHITNTLVATNKNISKGETIAMDVILKGKYIIKCKIRAVTGLHIGEGNNSIEIGGIDNAVVKDAEGKPYIPGSSLKGKMRALMEFAEGKVKDDLMVVAVKKGDKPEICLHMCDDKDCPVCGLFGRNHGLHDKRVAGKLILRMQSFQQGSLFAMQS